jgi:hypothetical protein
MENTKFNQNLLQCNLQTFVVDKEKTGYATLLSLRGKSSAKKNHHTVSTVMVKANVNSVILL